MLSAKAPAIAGVFISLKLIKRIKHKL